MIVYKHPLRDLPIGKDAIERGEIVSLPNDLKALPASLYSKDYYIYKSFGNTNYYYYAPKDPIEQARLAGVYDKIRSYGKSPAFRKGTEEAKAYNKGYGSTGVVRDTLLLSSILGFLLFAVPWIYFILTGQPLIY